MTVTLTPTLTVYRTISNPREEAEVIGFEGRDSTFGRNAIVLKFEAIPTTAERVGIPLGDVPNRAVYVLEDDVVYGAVASVVQSAPTYTFEATTWDHGRINCPALRWNHFDQWNRDEVEVSN